MAAGTSPATAAVPSEAPLSQAARVINTFISPTKTFTDIKRSASWWVPWVLGAVMSLAFVATAANKVGFEQIVDNNLRLRPKQMEQLEKAPPDQRARQMALSITITKAIAYAYPVVSLIVAVVIAAILLGSMNFGAGAQLKFGTVLAVVIYAGLPGLIKAGLAIVSLLAGVSPEGFTFENPIASNLSFIGKPGSPLYTLGASLDVFTIWILVLCGIGLACVSKVKRSTTMAIVFGWWAVMILLGVGMAAMFS
jgi:hypothetical protein